MAHTTEQTAQPKVSMDDLSLFARQMFSLTRAGIPLFEAIQGLAGTTTNKRLVDALYDVLGQLERGSIIASLNRHPKIFNRLFVSIVMWVKIQVSSTKHFSNWPLILNEIKKLKTNQECTVSVFCVNRHRDCFSDNELSSDPDLAGMFRKLGRLLLQ